MSGRLIPAAEFAAELGYDDVKPFLLLRRKKGWPAVKVANRFFFTEEQRAHIIAAQTTGTASTGQTGRSAARNRGAR